MIANGLMQEFKDAALLLTAGGDGAPDRFAPLLPSHTARSLRNMAIQHHKANGLLRLQGILKFDSRIVDGKLLTFCRGRG